MKRILQVLVILLPGLLAWVSASEAKVKLNWNQKVGDAMGNDAPLVVHDGLLYGGDYALDARTGKVLREFVSENVGYAIRLIRFSENVVFFSRAQVENEEETNRSFDYLWNAFDLKTGKLLWEITASGGHTRQEAPALMATCGRRVLVIKDQERGQACCVEARSGKTLWTKTINGSQDLEAGQERFFLQTEESLIAFSSSDGRELWKTRLPLSHLEKMTVGKELIYIPRKEVENGLGILLALNQQTGKVAWQKDFPKEDLFQATEWQGTLFFISQPENEQPGALLALQALTGREKWRQEVVADYNGNDFQPKLFGDKLLIWSGDAAYLKKYASSGIMRLLCLDPADGRIAWKYFPPYPEAVYYRLVPGGREVFIRTSERLLRLQVGQVGTVGASGARPGSPEVADGNVAH